MQKTTKFYLTEDEKKKFIDALTPELSMLRAKSGISQDELANFIGISRQTYGAIERKSKLMSWSTYLSLILFYVYNKKTHNVVRSLQAFPHELIESFNDGEEPGDFDLGMFFKADRRDIIDTLDEQALSTIRTVLMVEYSRCNNLSGDKTIRFFEGIDFLSKSPTQKQKNITQAVKNLKRKNNR